MIHRFTTAQGIELIKKFENFSNKPYLCPAGFWTIGYGHKMVKYENIELTETEAIEFLRTDLFYAEKAVLQYINTPLDNNQFDSLVSFTYNCGSGAMQRSTLRQKINSTMLEEVKIEFLKWIYVRGQKMLGLVYRRTAESNLFFSKISYDFNE